MNSRLSIYRRTRSLRRPIAGLISLALLIAAFGVELHNAGAETQSIKDVEAAFVYQFTNYVEWPLETFERSGDDFAITVVGDRELSDVLTRLVAGKGFDGRAFRVQSVDDVSDVPFAHIVFVGDVADPGAALSAGLHFDGQALTVSDRETFTRDGGIMRLYQEDSRVRIEVNIDAAERSDLKISSKLLQLARIVRDQSDE